MPDNKHSLEFALKLNAQDAKFIEDTLKRLATQANSLADAFAKLNTGGMSTGSLTTNGVPTAGALGQALAMRSGSRYSLPIIGHVKDMGKELRDAAPAIKNFTLEYAILMDTLNQPLPAGAASVLNAIRGVGAARGAGTRTSAGTAPTREEEAIAGGPPAPPPVGVAGGPPSDGEGPGGRRRRPSALEDLASGARIQAVQQSTERIVNDVYRLATVSQTLNMRSLDNQIARISVDRMLMQSDVAGDITKRIAMRQMGGMAAIRRDYGTTGADTAKDIGLAGVGLAGAGYAALQGVAAVAAGAALGPVGWAAIAGTVLGGGYMASTAIGDIVSGGPQARTELKAREAIEKQIETDPYSPFVKEMSMSAVQRVQTSRALNRMMDIRTGGLGEGVMQSPYMMLRGYAAAAGLPMERGESIAFSMGSRTNIATRRGIENITSLMDLEEMGYSADQIGEATSTLLNRGLGTPESLVGGAEAYLGKAKFMASSLLSATGQLSRTRFGAGGGAGAGTTMAMLAAGGGAMTPERLAISTAAFQQMQGGATENFPYMVKLQQIVQRFPDLPNWKQMLLAQMGQADLANPKKIAQVLGVTEEEAKRMQEVVAPIETNLKFGFLSRESGVGKKIAEEYGGDIYRFLQEGKPSGKELTEIAGTRMAFGGGDIDILKQELRMRPVSAGGIGGKVRDMRGDKGLEQVARSTIDTQFEGERVAFARVADEVAQILADTASRMRAVLASNGKANGKVAAKTTPSP